MAQQRREDEPLEIQVANFTGMNADLDIGALSNGEVSKYRFALNALYRVDSRQNQRVTVGHLENEDGNVKIMDFDKGETVCGHVENDTKGSLYVFTKVNLNGNVEDRIYRVYGGSVEEPPKCEKLLKGNDLGFVNGAYSTGVHVDVSKYGEYIVYTNGVSLVRRVFVDNLSFYGKKEGDWYVLQEEKKHLINLTYRDAIACAKYDVCLVSGGRLRVGTYHIYVRYHSVDGYTSDWEYTAQMLTNSQNSLLGAESSDESFEISEQQMSNIFGQINQEDIDSTDLMSGNGLKVTIDLREAINRASYAYVEVGIAHLATNQAKIDYTYVTPKYLLPESNELVVEVMDTGILEMKENGFFVNTEMRRFTANTLAISDDRIVFGGIKDITEIGANYQMYASSIKVRAKKERYLFKRYEKRHPLHPSYVTHASGYQGGETYVFGISYIMKDGSETPVYPIPNLTFSPTASKALEVVDTPYPTNTEGEYLLLPTDLGKWPSQLGKSNRYGMWNYVNDNKEIETETIDSNITFYGHRFPSMDTYTDTERGIAFFWRPVFVGIKNPDKNKCVGYKLYRIPRREENMSVLETVAALPVMEMDCDFVGDANGYPESTVPYRSLHANNAHVKTGKGNDTIRCKNKEIPSFSESIQMDGYVMPGNFISTKNGIEWGLYSSYGIYKHCTTNTWWGNFNLPGNGYMHGFINTRAGITRQAIAYSHGHNVEELLGLTCQKDHIRPEKMYTGLYYSGSPDRIPAVKSLSSCKVDPTAFKTMNVYSSASKRKSSELYDRNENAVAIGILMPIGAGWKKTQFANIIRNTETFTYGGLRNTCDLTASLDDGWRRYTNVPAFDLLVNAAKKHCAIAPLMPPDGMDKPNWKSHTHFAAHAGYLRWLQFLGDHRHNMGSISTKRFQIVSPLFSFYGKKMIDSGVKMKLTNIQYVRHVNSDFWTRRNVVEGFYTGNEEGVDIKDRNGTLACDSRTYVLGDILPADGMRQEIVAGKCFTYGNEEAFGHIANITRPNGLSCTVEGVVYVNPFDVKSVKFTSQKEGGGHKDYKIANYNTDNQGIVVSVDFKDGIRLDNVGTDVDRSCNLEMSVKYFRVTRTLGISQYGDVFNAQYMRITPNAVSFKSNGSDVCEGRFGDVYVSPLVYVASALTDFQAGQRAFSDWQVADIATKKAREHRNKAIGWGVGTALVGIAAVVGGLLTGGVGAAVILGVAGAAMGFGTQFTKENVVAMKAEISKVKAIESADNPDIERVRELVDDELLCLVQRGLEEKAFVGLDDGFGVNGGIRSYAFKNGYIEYGNRPKGVPDRHCAFRWGVAGMPPDGSEQTDAIKKTDNYFAFSFLGAMSSKNGEWASPYRIGHKSSEVDCVHWVGSMLTNLFFESPVNMWQRVTVGDTPPAIRPSLFDDADMQYSSAFSVMPDEYDANIGKRCMLQPFLWDKTDTSPTTAFGKYMQSKLIRSSLDEEKEGLVYSGAATPEFYYVSIDNATFDASMLSSSWASDATGNYAKLFFPTRIYWTEKITMQESNTDISVKINNYADVGIDTSPIRCLCANSGLLYVFTETDCYLYQPNEERLEAAESTLYVGTGEFMARPSLRLFSNAGQSLGVDGPTSVCVANGIVYALSKRDKELYIIEGKQCVPTAKENVSSIFLDADIDANASMYEIPDRNLRAIHSSSLGASVSFDMANQRVVNQLRVDSRNGRYVYYDGVWYNADNDKTFDEFLSDGTENIDVRVGIGEIVLQRQSQVFKDTGHEASTKPVTYHVVRYDELSEKVSFKYDTIQETARRVREFIDRHKNHRLLGESIIGEKGKPLPIVLWDDDGYEITYDKVVVVPIHRVVKTTTITITKPDPDGDEVKDINVEEYEPKDLTITLRVANDMEHNVDDNRIDLGNGYSWEVRDVIYYEMSRPIAQRQYFSQEGEEYVFDVDSYIKDHIDVSFGGILRNQAPSYYNEEVNCIERTITIDVDGNKTIDDVHVKKGITELFNIVTDIKRDKEKKGNLTLSFERGIAPSDTYGMYASWEEEKTIGSIYYIGQSDVSTEWKDIPNESITLRAANIVEQDGVTFSYSLMSFSYVSMHSYHPTLLSGVRNSLITDAVDGIYAHGAFADKQRFYGRNEPYMVAVSPAKVPFNTIVEGVSFKTLASHRVGNDTLKSDETFNVAYLSNRYQRSPRIELIPCNTNNGNFTWGVESFDGHPNQDGSIASISRKETVWFFNGIRNHLLGTLTSDNLLDICRMYASDPHLFDDVQRWTESMEISGQNVPWHQRERLRSDVLLAVLSYLCQDEKVAPTLKLLTVGFQLGTSER